MAVRPFEGCSSNSSSAPVSSNNVFTDLIEVSNSAGTYGNTVVSAVNVGAFSTVLDDGYDGQLMITSTTTALSGGSLRIGGSNIFPKSGDSMRIWFKMPANIDSGTTILAGFSDIATATPTNLTGAQIVGNLYKGCGIVSGTITLSSTSYTLTASARYCIEVKYLTNTTASIKLYDSSNGNVLDTSTITVTTTRRIPIIIAVNSGILAKDLVIIDAMEYKLVQRGVRFPV